MAYRFHLTCVGGLIFFIKWENIVTMSAVTTAGNGNSTRAERPPIESSSSERYGSTAHKNLHPPPSRKVSRLAYLKQYWLRGPASAANWNWKTCVHETSSEQPRHISLGVTFGAYLGTAASSVGSSRCRLGVIAYARCNGTVNGVVIAFKCLGRFNISHELNSFFDTPFQTPRSRRIILPCAEHYAVTYPHTHCLFTAECATQVLWRSSLWLWLY